MTTIRGGSRIFGRRWEAVFFNFKKFVDLSFFLGRQIDFLSSPQALQSPCFGKNFEKKQAEKGIFRHFLDNFEQEIAFFPTRALPSKLVYIGAIGAFRTN